MAGCILACQSGIGSPPHPSRGYPSPGWGGGTVHPAFATLTYVAELEEMVISDTSLFCSAQNFQQQAAHGVVAAFWPEKKMLHVPETLGF